MNSATLAPLVLAVPVFNGERFLAETEPAKFDRKQWQAMFKTA